MDDQLKARLIGAVLLVALAVLLIPELLSGRKAAAPAAPAPGEGRGTRTYTIDLTGAVPAQSVPRPQAGLEASPVATAQTRPPPDSKVATAVAPATAESPAAGRGPGLPKPTTETTLPPAIPVTPVQPPRASVKGGWSVQVGAFSSAATAGKLVADLEAAGYPAYVAPISRGGKTLHRVRVGPEAARGDADRLAARLQARKLPAAVVAND